MAVPSKQYPLLPDTRPPNAVCRPWLKPCIFNIYCLIPRCGGQMLVEAVASRVNWLQLYNELFCQRH